MFSQKRQEGQRIFIDGDDTLWFCNRYYERAIQAFVAFLNHSLLTPQEVRAVLSEIDAQQGYGTVSFTHSLQQTYQRLAERQQSTDDLDYIERLGEKLLHQPIELIDGVKETLDYLGNRHDLILLTRGDHGEQQRKVEQSGLATYFQQVIIVAKKETMTYKNLIQEFGLDPARSWMIGDSPRSDINPALQAGLNAVYIPQSSTWTIEQQALCLISTRQLLQLRTFTELRHYF